MNQNTPNESKGNIIVIDDTPVNLRLLSELLTKQGYRVRAARDGKTAIHSVQTHLPDLILLDIKMPEMDGYEVCTHLKADELTRDIPVIFISALSDADDIVRAFEVGGVDYITKPFKFREVLARVENHLTLRRQRQQIEQTQERERQYFAKINKMKDHFVRAATHDLKTPLAMIVGYTSLLRINDEVMGDKDATTYIEEISRGGEKMMRLVGEMLELLQIESGIDLNREPTSLKDIVHRATSAFQHQAHQKDITISLELPEDDCILQLDQLRITRVLDNLISNAIKYTNRGGSVNISTALTENYGVIKIQDTGIGIPKDAIPNLFDAFYRVRDSSSDTEVEGSGLGLSVVQSSIEQHQGTIEVESEHGVGSTFTVKLPITE